MPETHTSAGLIPLRYDNSEPSYLLLQYPQDHWGFPKGHLESDDESLRDAAVRELEEETGLRPTRFFDDFKEVLDYWFTLNEQRHHKTVYFFAGEVKPAPVELSEEHVDFGWYSREKTLAKITYDNERKLFEKWIDFYESERHRVEES